MTRSREAVAGRAALVLAATGLLAPGCGGRSLNASKQGQDGGGKADASVAGDTGTISRGDAQADAGTASEGPPVVDPAVSRAWTWSPCGAISPAPADLEAIFGSDGKIAVRSESGIRVYDRDGAVQPETDGPADLLTTGADGEVLVGRVTPTAIVLGPVGSVAPRFSFVIPANGDCGKATVLSWRGEYVLARSPDAACVWRAADGALLTALPILGGQAALRGDRLVSIVQPTKTSTLVMTRDFAGRETSRVELSGFAGEPVNGSFVNAVFVPTGDRLLTWDPATLWDLDSGKVIAWWVDPGEAPQYGIFSRAGDLVLLGGGVFRTRDGSVVQTIDPSSRTALFAYTARALSPDGGRVVVDEFGRATLEAPSGRGTLAILGGLPPPALGGRPSLLNRLALSADGSLLVANVFWNYAFGVRLASDFAQSRIVSTLFSYVSADVDVSADGAIAAIAGDGRGLFGAEDGRLIWSPPLPSRGAALCSTEKLRFSPQKTWAAGASHDQTIDVFDLGAVAGAAAPPPLLRLPSGCGDSAVFSHDERLMATSTPAVYRTAATVTGWQKVWSGPIPDEDRAYYYFGKGTSNDVLFSPDESELLVSQCSDLWTCSTTLLDVATGALVRALPEVTTPHPSFSPDGSWIVAGDTLVHLPSGDVQTLEPAAPAVPAWAILRVALFTPDGDIIAGWSEGSLARYCRNP